MVSRTYLKSNQGGGRQSAMPDLGALLTVLDKKLLLKLAEQAGLGKQAESEGRLRLIEGILKYARENPGKSLRLKYGKDPLRLRLEKGQTYYLRAPRIPWTRVQGNPHGIYYGFEEEEAGGPLGELELNPAWQFSQNPFGFQVLHMVSFDIPQGATFITEVWCIKCNTLNMGEGATLYGANPEGFMVEVANLVGDGTGSPVISTSVKPFADQPSMPGPGWQPDPTYGGMLRATPGVQLAPLKGAQGEHGESPDAYTGAKGRDGDCWLGGSRAGGRGEDVGNGAKGGDGGEGGPGYSTAPLSVWVKNSLSGRVKFSTSAGNGGDGGRGGDGQTIYGGAGGDIPMGCPNQPGAGGNAGKGGEAGPGGEGGVGGNSGSIAIYVPDGTTGSVDWAAVGGIGGCNGRAGAAGGSYGGSAGYWTVLGEPQVHRNNAEGTEDESPQTPPYEGRRAENGFDGEVWVNSNLVQPRQQGAGRGSACV